MVADEHENLDNPSHMQLNPILHCPESSTFKSVVVNDFVKYLYTFPLVLCS